MAGACVFAAESRAAGAAQSAGARVPFNAGWRFQKGDPAGVGDTLAYGRIKSWVIATGDDLLNPMAARVARQAGNPACTHEISPPGLPACRATLAAMGLSRSSPVAMTQLLILP